MTFYTSIFKSTKSPKKWIFLVLLSSFTISLFFISFNYIIDPYTITKYNILNIKYKFARDDRTEKVSYFKNLDTFDTVMIGSSRVYSINPETVSDILGGTTYNFGVGTATVEDLLGVIKFLKKENKLPKNILMGVDFYTFNSDIPPNKYFLKNRELNFLTYTNYDEDNLAKLFSIDAFRASLKTLDYHLFNKDKRSRFDSSGWAGAYEDYTLRHNEKDLLKAKQEADSEIDKIFSSYNYSKLDSLRIKYFEEIRELCHNNNITLYLFTTPIHPILLEKLSLNKNTNKALHEFISFLQSFENFHNLYHDKRIYKELRNFHGATHTSSNCGDTIVKIVLE
jgi:hypothetical protein